MSHSTHAHPRAYLRHQRRRILLRRWQQWRQSFLVWSPPPKSIEELDAWALKRLRRFASTPILCPCRACRHRNPRRSYGEETLREAWADIRLWEELLDAGASEMMPRRRFIFPLGLARQFGQSRRWLERTAEPGAEESTS
jgi:hypothetical protein